MRTLALRRGRATGVPAAQPLALGLIWYVHIGFDRMLDYGLKYSLGFHSTHLGLLGRGGQPDL